MTSQDSIPTILKAYREIIDNALRGSLADESLPVYAMLRYCMGWSDCEGEKVNGITGKAVRPSLCMFACESTGGDAKYAVPAAVALELIHNFSLIHDEIQDHDEIRHHRDTLWKVWGVPKALVAGNILRVVADKALEPLYQLGRPEAMEIGRNLVTEACLEMIEGQYLDISFEGRLDISQDEYIGMISRKTGALIRCSVNLGSYIGSVYTSDALGVERVSRFREVGEHLGYAFQIRDDILGVWGREEDTGKQVGLDIRRKKNSLPIVHALATADKKELVVLKKIYSKDVVSDNDVERVLDILKSLGSQKHAEDLAFQYCELAIKVLDTIDIDTKSRGEMEDLIKFLLVRTY